MEWITIVLLMCSTESDLKPLPKPECQAKLTRCIEWIQDQPQTKEKDLSRFDVAVWLSSDKSVRKDLCR